MIYMEPSPTKIETITEVIDGKTHVTNTKTGTTVNTVCVVSCGDPTQENYGFKGDYLYWDQPVQDKIDEFTVEGTANFIGVINVRNKRIFSFKFPTLEKMQICMEKLGERYGFCVPNFNVYEMERLES